MSSVTQSSSSRSYAQLTVGAVCISFAPILVKLLGDGIVGLTAIAFWRTLSGAGILFLLAVVYRRKLALPGSVFPWALLAGFLFFLDLSIWHRSVMYAGAGLSTILANTQVFNTAVLSFLFFRERLTLRFWFSAVSAIIGVILLAGVIGEVSLSNVYIHGIVFGLITGVVYASYLVTLKASGRREIKPDILPFMAWTSLFSAFFLLIGSAFEEGAFWPPTLYAIVVLFLLGLVVHALGWWAIFSSLSVIPASRAGLILLLQPTLATIWGWMIFSEELTALQLLGAGITIAAIYFGSVTRRVSPTHPATK